MEEKINLLTLPQGGTDSATAMAMMNNNPWMYLVMLALFGGGGFGFGGRGAGVNGALDIETQNKLSALATQINTNQNNDWAREAIQGNTFAISQLSQSLGVNYNALQGAIFGVQSAISQLGAQNGMGFAGVTNAINLGNLNLVQQLKDCCCGLKTQVLEQGYQGQIRTTQQTDELKDSQRIENGLTRAEIASFRQAWENSRYQDVVAEKTRLQTELDLLRTQQGTTAAIAPLMTKIQQMDYQMQQYFGIKTTASQAG